MSSSINLTGRWRFQEDFGFGKDSGYAQIRQSGKRLKGYLHFSEQIEGEETFIVKQEVTGKVVGNTINLKSHSCEILFSEEEIIYELDSWVGEILSNEKIVGRSEDSEGTGGVFVMEREAAGTFDDKPSNLN